jgi:hypothetical protein
VRRWFHCLLIGALASSLSVDTAKACWYLRHSHAARGCGRPACPPVATWTVCHEVVVHEVVVQDSVWCAEVTPGLTAPLAETVAPEQPSEPIVAVEPTPTPVEPAPTPAEPIVPPQHPAEPGVAAVAPVVPHLQPALDTERDVEPAVAIEPAPAEPVVEAEPTPKPAPDATAVETPAPPVQPNLFEEVEAPADSAPDATEPAAQPDEPTSAPAADNLFGTDAAAQEPVDEPVASDPAADPTSAPDAVAPAPAADEPAAPSAADPFGNTGSEPMRRWIDDTGSYATVGMLVELRADGVEIRKGNGRSVIVPLDRLSAHDRSYAAAAGARLAAERTASSSSTAGL